MRCNVINQWGIDNGVDMKVVWCPDASYLQMAAYTFNLPVIDFFPAPDANAIGGKYVKVIGPDAYMKGYGVSGVAGISAGYTTPLATNTNWSLGTFVAMCQAYGCSFALCETGDGPGADKNNSSTDGVLAAVATYLNTFKTLTPPVPIEFIALYDLTSGVASQFSGGNSPAMTAAWRAAVGTGGNNSVIPAITTIAASN